MANNVVKSGFENRMENWRDTVRGGTGRKGSPFCAGWAAAYVAARHKQEEKIAMELQIVEYGSDLWRADVDELDGWIIEAAVRSLPHFDQAQVLRFRYVHEYPNHFIKDRLRAANAKINDAAIRIILGRAIINLNLMLENLKTPDKIRSYNSHARCVPRLKA